MSLPLPSVAYRSTHRATTLTCCACSARHRRCAGVVNLISTFVAIFAVDKFGRRVLFLQGGVQMLIAQASQGAGWAGGGAALEGEGPPLCVCVRALGKKGVRMLESANRQVEGA